MAKKSAKGLTRKAGKRHSKTSPKRPWHPQSASTLGDASVAELKAELSRRKRRERSLEVRRARLLEELGKVEKDLIALRSLGGEIPGSSAGAPLRQRRRARGPNKKTLLVHLEEVLQGKVLSVSESAEAVLANGYCSNSKTFRTIVNQTLLANDVFERVGHGCYTLRS